jgi:[histone H3]-trimethyl-L-lysine4 demethylase
MEGATRSTMSYLDKLAKFHRQQGTTLTRHPSLDKQPIDLYQLKKAVDSRGGFKEVCNMKRWADIGRELGYGGIKNITSVSTALKNAFQKYLLPYEMYLEKAKPEFLREMGLTPSPQQERKIESSSPLGMRRTLLEQIESAEAMDEDEIKTESEDMPPNGLKRAFDESSTTSEDKEPVRRESKRLKKGTIPLKTLADIAAPMVVGSNMAQHAHKPSRMGASPSKKPGENCEVCGRGDNALSMLLCDGCDTGYHTFCLDPPLKAIPKYDWYCAQCLVGTNEFGFEEGEEYSLQQFREKADSFREEYISKNLNGVSVSEEQVEEEFWRMVSNVQETVEVDYGADIHSTTHGSGFPTVETNPTDPYATDPWNLNVLPLDNQSLFRHIKSDVSGMTVPWLYVGMMFSTFCWHNEDHYCYSINYQHFGATKTWYGIPGSDSAKFEAAMRNAVPDLFETQPDLLFQLVTMLSPGLLKEEGVQVYAVDQRPNQFVITFPQAYHAGFNHGFNMNEAVNFAPSDWEEYGRECVQRYSEYKKPPVFSHDELLITAALHDSSIKTAKWFVF